MVWKLLSGIAAACLAAAVYFAVVNREALKTEKMLAARAEKDHADAIARKAEGEAMQKNKTDRLATLKKELEDTKQKVAEAAAESQQKDAALQLAKTTLTQVSQQVTTIQTKIIELGDVEKLLAQVASLKQDQQAAEGALASQTQQLAMKTEAVTSLQGEITRYRDLEVRARKGIVEPGFTARVASVFSNWGFVILDKGNSGGVFANADLEVKRGKDVVAKLKVRNVEQQISVADVIPGSVVAGNAPRSGDLVVASATQSATPPPTPAVPAPGVGAAVPDALGAPPVAPAPNAAAMGNDPFGAAPMPAGAAPAAPAAADPFGGAAPAAPAPAAPAAGGTGTKASPSTADPFGAAPATPAAGTPAAPATPPAGAAPATPAAGAPATPAAGAPAAPPAGGAVDPFAPPPAK